MANPPRFDNNWEGDIDDWEPGLQRDYSLIDPEVARGTGYATARAHELTKKVKRTGKAPITQVEYSPSEKGLVRTRAGYYITDNQKYQTNKLNKALSDSVCLYSTGNKKWVGSAIGHRRVIVIVHCVRFDGFVYSETDPEDPSVAAEALARWIADLSKAKVGIRYLINRGWVVIPMVIHRSGGETRSPGGGYIDERYDAFYPVYLPDGGAIPNWMFFHSIPDFGDGQEDADQILRWVEEAIAYALDYDDPTLLEDISIRSLKAKQHLAYLFVGARVSDFHTGYPWDEYDWTERCWSNIFVKMGDFLHQDLRGWLEEDSEVYSGYPRWYRIPEHARYQRNIGYDNGYIDRWQEVQFRLYWYLSNENWYDEDKEGWLIVFDYATAVIDEYTYEGWYTLSNFTSWRLPYPDYVYEKFNGIWSEEYQHRII